MILEVLKLLVIAGILNSAHAHQGNIPRKQAMVPTHLIFLGYVNTSIAEIEKFDEDMCTKNGGPNAYDAHKQSWEHWSRCVNSVRDEINDEVSHETHPPDHSMLDSFYEKYCLRVPNFENCFKNITDSMKTCLDPEKHESANIIYNIISSVMRFVCADGTPRITETEISDAEKCLYSKRSNVQACANQTIVTYMHTTLPNGAAIGGLGALHLLVPDSEKCSVIENFQTCFVDELKDCLPPTIAHLEKSIFNLIKEETTCNKWFKSQASPTHVVNLLLIIGVIVMSLRFTYNK